MNPSITPQTSTSFETSLRALEETVELLEAGDLPLEESLVLFEKGVASLRHCHAVLDVAEKRVRLLVKSANGTVVLEEITPVPRAPATTVAPVRKKSAKQSVDLEASTRQNTAPLTESTSARSPISTGESGGLTQESSPEETGLGGSLFGVSK